MEIKLTTFRKAMWNGGNTNVVAQKMLRELKNVDHQLWDYSHKWLQNRIDKLTKDGKIDADVAKRLKENITAMDLMLLSNPATELDAAIRIMKKSKNWKSELGALDQLTGWRKNKKTGLEEVHKHGLTAKFDYLRDRIIKKHLELVQQSDPSLDFIDMKKPYTGSAAPIDLTKPIDANGNLPSTDAANILKDRDMLFQGKDAEIGLAMFVRSMNEEFGPNWADIIHGDGFLDYKYDYLDNPNMVPKDLPPAKKAKIEKYFDEHRNEINKIVKERHKNVGETGGTIEVENDFGSADNTAKKLIVIDRLKKQWLDTYDPEIYKAYLKAKREYLPDNPETYLTPGARRIEMEYRAAWADKGYEKGDDWIKHMKNVENGKVDIDLVDRIDALENIMENEFQALNHMNPYISPSKKAAVASKYYERSIRSGALCKDPIQLNKYWVNGRNLEELRQLAMRVKENGKTPETAQVIVAEIYGAQKNMEPVMETYMRDLKAGLDKVNELLKK